MSLTYITKHNLPKKSGEHRGTGTFVKFHVTLTPNRQNLDYK